MRLLRVAIAGLLALGAVCAGVEMAPAAEQTLRGRRQPTLSESFIARRADAKSRMLVHADEMVYDYRNNRVSAAGNVQIYYDGGVLEANRVTYDRKNHRVYAEGKVRYRTRDGHLIHAETLEITDDLREGFISSLLVESAERTRFAATRADRSEGKVTVYRSGIYTACAPCKDDPKRPPLWQVRAARIIHDESERVIHYEDARLEFMGIPIAYLPFFAHPDPTVRRQSGFLAPQSFSSTRTGVGVELPYYWAIAPNKDITVSLAPLTRQGLLAKSEWRHRLINGAYAVRVAGIFQRDPGAFFLGPAAPAHPGMREFRGSVETTGEVFINKQWAWGWDATLLSDRLFLRDYSLGRTAATERTSQVYLVGQGDRSHFDLRAMAFTGLTVFDRNDEQPLVHPVLDYSYIFREPVVGGEVAFRANLTSLSRRQADFDPTNSAAQFLNLCDSRAVMLATNPSNCLMRGTPGDYTRLSADMTWRRTAITSWGQIITPFIVARGDIAYHRTAPDPGVAAFMAASPEGLVRAMPALGFETRWPLISAHAWGTQILEPIAQLVVRPDETQIGRFPNEDAQSLIFDDTNIFSINKYSGFDRVEGGTRLNVGVLYTANINRFGTFSALVGQSYHLFGRNSFAFSGTIDPMTGMQTGLGLQSGLEEPISDYVARFSLQTSKNLMFVNRYRFDKDNLTVRRFELETSTAFGAVALSTIYARYEAQPLIGYIQRRDGVFQNAALRISSNWTVSGGVRYDFTQGRVDLGILTLAYLDECFAIAAQYIADYTYAGSLQPDHRFLLRVNLRTLGGPSLSTRFGGPD
jgi:LPS-assembly protein